MSVPSGVSGKYSAREALRVGPLEQAGGADTAGIEGIPMMFANALPAAIGLGRPIAMRAANARLGGEAVVIVKKFLFLTGLNNCRRQAELAFACCAHIHQSPSQRYLKF